MKECDFWILNKMWIMPLSVFGVVSVCGLFILISIYVLVSQCCNFQFPDELWHAVSSHMFTCHLCIIGCSIGSFVSIFSFIVLLVFSYNLF